MPSSPSRARIAIVGATGYTGSELVRLLIGHPRVDIVAITSESRAGVPFSGVHPAFGGLVDMPLKSMEDVPALKPDLIFLALPHTVSMDAVARFRPEGIPIVDLSADYRLSGPEPYAQWYGVEHRDPEGFEGAVYGLPERHRKAIRSAKLVANPGCYPTATILALAPLVEAGLVEGPLVADAKSGVTGAGVKPKPTTHYANVADNFRAYGVAGHRHTAEIEEQLALASKKAGGQPLHVQFTPHLLPVDRGILSTVYARPRADAGLSAESLADLYRDAYGDEPFVRLRQQAPSLKDVRASNHVDIMPVYDARTGMVLVLSAIDNLVKGAAGQAVQNMNLMLDFPETEGLRLVPLAP